MAHWQGQLVKVDDYRWKIPENYKAGMRVPCISTRYSSVVPGHAGYPLGLWISYRRSGSNGR